MEGTFNYLNNNILFNGIIMFIMNIGGKYIAYEIPESLDIIFNKYKFLRYIVVFSIGFIATRNIQTSILLTLIFLLVFKYLINEKKNINLLGIKTKKRRK